MEDKLLRLVTRLLRLPAEPEAPEAPARVFRAARPYYTYLLLAWGVKQVGAAIGLAAGLYFTRYVPAIRLRLGPLDAGDLSAIMAFFEVLAIIGFLLQIPFTLAAVRLDYLMRWYIVTDRSLRIREGTWHVRELTMSFANVQQIAVERGPIHGLLGIADVKVRSAGGGAAEAHDDKHAHGPDLHLAYFRGVTDHEAIRQLLRERAGRSRDAGLGDPGDAHPEPAPEPEIGETAPADVLAAAELLRDEARALREAVRQDRR